MDMVSGIAKMSMDMATERVSTLTQVAVLKNVMDAQKETMAILLESLGIGGKLDVKG
ncbi:hypothetical protein FACS1894187_20110 [Synergistales bacterium]|nr:hypothetical protein FACS1894187_20110 [Synergistales bacterium]